MTKHESRYEAQIKAVAQVHESIKEICEKIGLDVSAAERFSKDNDFVLPWHDEAHPKTLIKNSQEIIRDAPDIDKKRDEIALGIAGSKHANTCTGLMGALAIVDSNWSSAAKRAFIDHFTIQAGQIYYDLYTLPLSSDGIQAMDCWLINDICTACTLKATNLTGIKSALIDLIIADQIERVASIAFFMASNKEDESTAEVKSIVEDALLTLPTADSRTGAIVKKLFPRFQASCNPTNERSRIIKWHEALKGFYPDPIQSQDLDGERISSEASTKMNQYLALEDLSEQLKPHLIQQQEWSDPLGAVIEDLKVKKEVIIFFSDRNLVTCPKAKEIFIDLIGRDPNMTITFLTNIFATRGPEDPSLQEIAGALNAFIDTNQLSMLNGVTNSADDATQVQIVDFLRSVTEVVGKNRVKILTPQQFKDSAEPHDTPNCVISTYNYAPATPNESCIEFILDKIEPKESAVKLLDQVVAISPESRFVLSFLARCIRHAVLPNLAKKQGGQDKHGLNGCRSVAMGLHLSQSKISGLGALPTFTEADLATLGNDMTLLTIRYTGNTEEDTATDPIDEEELAPEDDLVLPGKNQS